MGKVLVAHPGKQHSYRTAMALQKVGILDAYVTTTYQKKGSITNLITNLLPGKIRKKAGSHYLQGLDTNKVVLFDELLALMSSLIERTSLDSSLKRKINLFRIDHFGRRVAQYAIKHKVDAVIMWDTTSVECFKILKKRAPQIKRILDCSTANRLYFRNIYDRDMKKFSHSCFKEDIPFLWEVDSERMYNEEIENAEIFIGASEFVEKSYVFSGVSQNRIRRVPYGVDTKIFEYTKRVYNVRPLKMVFVGGVTERKGIHHLLEVMSRFDLSEVVLDLVGGYDKESKIYQKVKEMDNVKLSGFVTRDEIVGKYHEADVYIFPTLGEGMTMSGFEAMSTGLPMLCSDNAGYNHVISDGYNGFIFKTGDIDDMYEKIKYCLENKESLEEMGIHARNTAKEFTWDVYYKKYSHTISQIIEN